MKTLLKYHSALYLEAVGTNNFQFSTSATTGYNTGWTQVDPAVFVSERILDCAGLAMNDETLYFDGITVQEGGTGMAITGDAGDSFIVYDIVSAVPINMATDYGKIILFGAGFPAGGKSNFEHIPYARTSRYTIDLDTAAAFAFKVSSEQSGSMEATASDRLYCYRLVFTFGGPNCTAIGVGSARVLCAITVKEEPTYEYLMRLKRSYDLQQGRDED